MKNKWVVCGFFVFIVFVFTAMALMVWFNQLLDRKTAS